MVKSISASASRKFLNLDASERKIAFPVKSISASASRKFLNELLVGTHIPEPDIDLSFSEPKIPQVPSLLRHTHPPRVYRSQLQRAENSSTIWTGTLSTICAIDLSFSEPKIPQRRLHAERRCGARRSISASASRKFLNKNDQGWLSFRDDDRSQLQRAENYSTDRCRVRPSLSTNRSQLQRAENSSTLTIAFNSGSN